MLDTLENQRKFYSRLEIIESQRKNDYNKKTKSKNLKLLRFKKRWIIIEQEKNQYVNTACEVQYSMQFKLASHLKGLKT